MVTDNHSFAPLCQNRRTKARTLASMSVLLRFFFNLCLMRESPEHTPASPLLTAIFLAAVILVQYLALVNNTAIDISPMLAVGWAVVLTALFSGAVWLILRTAEKEERFSKTLNAILGCDLLLTLPRVLLVLPYAGGTEDAVTAGTLILAILSLGLQIYELTVIGFILKHAINTTLARGFLLALAIILMTLVGTAILLPLPALPGA